jgi:hypothetical protein
VSGRSKSSEVEVMEYAAEVKVIEYAAEVKEVK